MALVKGFALQWSISTNKGAVNLQIQSGPGTGLAQLQIPVDSATELAALADILRGSSDVQFEPREQVLSTTFKAPGSA
jgi:hypothetical protein